MLAQREGVGLSYPRCVEAARRQRLGRLALYALGAFGLPLLFFLISLHNVYDYGETSDEAYDQAIGGFYYEDYPKTGFADLDVRLDPLQRNYGAFWDIVDVWSGDVLVDQTGWLHVTKRVAAHHVSVIVRRRRFSWAPSFCSGRGLRPRGRLRVPARAAPHARSSSGTPRTI